MITPEAFLSKLNSSLRQLRGAASILRNDEINKNLLLAMRKLTLAEVLNENWIIAVGGSQGAGKTTLISHLYGITDWLRGNEGRGEKLPVLLVEKEGIEKPQGYVRRLLARTDDKNFELKEVEVGIEEFHEAIFDPRVEDFLPVLHVPKNYFTRSNQAWLLLPGYEKQDRKNRDWQELMRQAMLNASGCLVVTDETRMANQQQVEIVNDMLTNVLDACKPYVIVTKTEAHMENEEKCQELRRSAAKTFKVDEELTQSNIILTGVDNAAYTEIWLPKLKHALAQLNYSGNSNRVLQLEKLHDLIDKDLGRIFNDLETNILTHFHSSENDQKLYSDIMNTFDGEVTKIRGKYSVAINASMNALYEERKKKLDNILPTKFEGFFNNAKKFIETETKNYLALEEAVKNSWQNEKNAQENLALINKKIAEQLRGLTFERLKVNQNPEARAIDFKDVTELENYQIAGYLADDGQSLIAFNSLTDDSISDIKLLLGMSSQDNNLAESSKRLKHSVKLLPALSLEYSRLSLVDPIIASIDFKSLESDPTQTVEQLVEKSGKGVELGRTALRSMAAVLAIDVASDGDSDILNTIFGKTVPTTDVPTEGVPTAAPLLFGTAGIAVIGVVAAAFIGAYVLKLSRDRDGNNRRQAHNMLASIREQHVIAHLNHYDDMMEKLRERLENSLRKRYSLDESFAKKERLVVALTKTRSIADDILEQISGSQVGLNALMA